MRRELDAWRAALLVAGERAVAANSQPLIATLCVLRITLQFRKRRRVDADNALAALKPLIDLTQTPTVAITNGRLHSATGWLGWVANDRQYGVELVFVENAGADATLLDLVALEG